jgi:RimJ/RimL family protein N-acetyltransferase
MVVDKIIMGLKSVLAPMAEEDLKLIKEWASDPLVCNNYHKSLAKEECFLKELISGGNDHVKAYTIGTEDSIVIGKLIMEIEDDNTANMDILIGEKIYVGKGYGKDALKAAIKHCFEYLNLDAVKVTMKKDNMRTEYCCWACGLREDKTYIPGEENNHTSRMIIYKKDYTGY